MPRGEKGCLNFLYVELAGKYRLPAIYFQKEFVDEGGLMSYGADFDDLFRRPFTWTRS